MKGKLGVKENTGGIHVSPLRIFTRNLQRPTFTGRSVFSIPVTYDNIVLCFSCVRVCSQRDGNILRGSRVRELWSDFHAIVETRRHWALLV